MNPWPIAPLETKDLDFAVVNYDFTGLTAGELADLPNLESAIDLSLGDFALSLADQTVLVPSLFDGLNDLGNIPGEIDGFEFDLTAGELSKASTDGDTLLDNYTSLVGGSSPQPAGPATFTAQLSIAFTPTTDSPQVVCLQAEAP